MKLSTKFGIVLVVLLFATIAVFSNSLFQLFQHTEIRSRAKISEELRRAVRGQTGLQVSYLADSLAALIEKELRTPNSSKDLLRSQFLALGILSPSQNDRSGWVAEWMEARYSNLSQKWLRDQLDKLQPSSVKQNESVFNVISSQDGRTYFSLMFPMSIKSDLQTREVVAIGILPTSIFANLNDIAKSSQDKVFVVNQAGMAMSYPEIQYVGGSATAHPIVASLVNGVTATSTTGYPGDDDKKIFGGYERVPNSNLYAISAYSEPSVTAFVSEHIIRLTLWLSALFLTAYFAFVYLTKMYAKYVKSLEQNLEFKMKIQLPQKIETIQIDTGEEKTKEFARSVIQFLRVPLANLIGRLHLLEGQTQDKKVIETIKQMVSEARKVREFTDALEKAAQANVENVELVELNPLVSQAVSVVQNQINKSQIQLEENWKADLTVRGDYNNLKSTVRALLQYAVDKLCTIEGQRVLTLNIEKRGGSAWIVIGCKGVLLDAEERRNIFKPFVLKNKNGSLMSMDMALAQQYADSIGGGIRVENLSYQGFEIVLQMPAIEFAMKKLDMANYKEVDL